MTENNSNNHAPIFTFLNKHKWRILAAVLFTIGYAVPIYNLQTNKWTWANCSLVINSPTTNESRLREEIRWIEDEIASEDFLEDLNNRHNLFPKKNDDFVSYSSLMADSNNYIVLYVPRKSLTNGVRVEISVGFANEDSEKIVAILSEIEQKFKTRTDWKVERLGEDPKAGISRFGIIYYVEYLKDAFWNSIYYSSILILLWEFPFLLYSNKTRQMIFEPLKADWQDELTKAKLNKQTWKSLEINVRYSIAFVFSMIQQSPVGSLLYKFDKLIK